MTVRVVATDEQTGERDERVILDGDYLLICVRPAHLTYTNAYGNGTHVLTIKDTGISPNALYEEAAGG